MLKPEVSKHQSSYKLCIPKFTAVPTMCGPAKGVFHLSLLISQSFYSTTAYLKYQCQNHRLSIWTNRATTKGLSFPLAWAAGRHQSPQQGILLEYFIFPNNITLLPLNIEKGSFFTKAILSSSTVSQCPLLPT